MLFDLTDRDLALAVFIFVALIALPSALIGAVIGWLVSL